MISATVLSQLPKHVQSLVQGVSNRSVADLQQLCDQVADWSTSELRILQPVFYIHLHPDGVPAKSTPATTTDIELARWSFVGIVTIFDNGSRTEAKQHLVSAWNRVVPWLLFFHDQFIMCRANYRPVDKKLVIDLVGKILQHAFSARDGNTPLLTTTPTLYRLIVELWLLALNIKDKDALFSMSTQHPLSHSHYRYLTTLELISPILATGCMRDEAFMAVVLEVSGDTGAVASMALKYVKSVRSMAQDPDAISRPSTSPELLASMLSHCVRFIRDMSKRSVAMREECIVRQSVREIFLASRAIQFLLSFAGTMEEILKPSLFWSFEYLADLLDHADNTISVLHQALRSHAFEIALGTSRPLEVDLNDMRTSILMILYDYLVYDNILTYAWKHVDSWSNTLGPIATQDQTIQERWSAVETKIRLYAGLKSREERIRRPSPDEKGWILRCYCSDTTEDIQLRQCSGCQVVRYCSKRCQRESWYSHHKWSCKFLKAAVGSSTPHYVKRSLCLLSSIEAFEVLCRWGDIQSQIAAARCKYPQDQDRLVLKITIDEEELSVLPLRHYLFLFNGLSENEVVDRLSSWPDPRGHLQRSFFCSVIAINDRYSSQQILFSPHTALDMETVPTLSRNQQYLRSRAREYEHLF